MQTRLFPTPPSRHRPGFLLHRDLAVPMETGPPCMVEHLEGGNEQGSAALTEKELQGLGRRGLTAEKPGRPAASPSRSSP
jgi:hypothetical protein